MDEPGMTFWAYNSVTKALYQIDNEEDAAGLCHLPRFRGYIIFKAYMTTAVK